MTVYPASYTLFVYWYMQETMIRETKPVNKEIYRPMLDKINFRISSTPRPVTVGAG